MNYKIIHINSYDILRWWEVVFNSYFSILWWKKISLDAFIFKNKIYRFFAKYFFDPILFFKLRFLYKKYNPDLILCHDFSLSPLTFLLSIFWYKVVQVVHSAFNACCPSWWAYYMKDYSECDVIPNFNKCRRNCWFSRIKRKYVYSIYHLWNYLQVKLRKKNINTFISPSESLSKILLKNWFKNVFVVNNPLTIDIKKFESQNLNKKNIILFVWAMIEKKGVLLLIDSLIKLKDILKDWEFVFIWEGPLLNSLKQKTKLLPQFTFTWFLNHNKVQEYFRIAKISILSTVSLENYPNVLIEWLLNNCIVIWSNRWWTIEILWEDLVFQVYDINNNTLSQKILEVTSNLDKYYNISQYQKEYIIKSNSNEIFCEKINMLLKTVL